MFCLSVSQPWARLLCLDLKDIENRTYPPPREAIGQPLLIHAPLEPDPGAWDPEQKSALPVWLRRGIVIADSDEPDAYQFGGIVGWKPW